MTQARPNMEVPGQILITFALSFIFVLAVIAFAVDAAGAWRVSMRQQDALQVTKDYVLGNGTFVKSEGDGCMAASNLAEERICAGDLLPDEGHPRTVKITTFESPAVDTDLDRYIGVKIEIEDTYETSFAKIIGIDTMPVRKSAVFVVNPYSTYGVDNIPSAVNGYVRTWEHVNEGGALDYTLKSTSHGESCPEDLKKAIQDAGGSHQGSDWEWGIAH